MTWGSTLATPEPMTEQKRRWWNYIGYAAMWLLFIAAWVAIVAGITLWLVLKVLWMVTALILQLFLIPFRW